MLAENGEITVTLPARGGENWGTFGKPGGDPLGVVGDGDEALLIGELGGVGVLGGEGLCLGLGLGEALGVLGAPDEVHNGLPLN